MINTIKTKDEIVSSVVSDLIEHKEIAVEAQEKEKEAFNGKKKAEEVKKKWHDVATARKLQIKSLKNDSAYWKRKYTELKNQIGIEGFWNKLLFLLKK